MEEVRELRSRSALARSAGERTSPRGRGGEPGWPSLFGDFLLAVQEKVISLSGLYRNLPGAARERHRLPQITAISG